MKKNYKLNIGPGPSTLTDRLIQLSGDLTAGEISARIDVTGQEFERGITIRYQDTSCLTEPDEPEVTKPDEPEVISSPEPDEPEVISSFIKSETQRTIGLGSN